ncbi:hypothetical protein [Paractinoplanes brasiliensis]|nr:hypothetical protein [Actinoplanes brasiliensis]
MDLYLLATLRMKERLRQAELAQLRPSVSRPRIVLARWLMAAARRLWPEAGREMAGAIR